MSEKCPAGDCVNCGRQLYFAPTELGWSDCGEHGKICFECIETLNLIMITNREASRQIPVNGEPVIDIKKWHDKTQCSHYMVCKGIDNPTCPMECFHLEPKGQFEAGIEAAIAAVDSLLLDVAREGKQIAIVICAIARISALKKGG
jgi:hypothetical protein